MSPLRDRSPKNDVLVFSRSRQYPRVTLGPRKQISPASPGASAAVRVTDLDLHMRQGAADGADLLDLTATLHRGCRRCVSVMP
jgi:hypothetical protein